MSPGKDTNIYVNKNNDKKLQFIAGTSTMYKTYS